MSVAKHTPGPWYVAEGSDCCFHDGNRFAICRDGHDGGEETSETVAEVWPAASIDIERADARLIAAAPDLLAALEQTQVMIRALSIRAGQLADAFHDDSYNDPWNEGGIGYETSTLVRAAIAKARA